MNIKHSKTLSVLLMTVMMAGAAVNTAQAGDSKEKDAKEILLFNQAKITLSDAIEAAQQKTGGKAIEAEVDDEAGTIQFEVEVIKDGKVHEVKVDGISGKVLKVALADEAAEDDEKDTEKEKD